MFFGGTRRSNIGILAFFCSLVLSRRGGILPLSGGEGEWDSEIFSLLPFAAVSNPPASANRLDAKDARLLGSVSSDLF